MFQKQPLRIKTPPYLKRAVCLSARNSCIKLLFIIIRNALEKFKKKKKKNYRSSFLEGKDQNLKIENMNVLKMEQNRQMHHNFYAKHKVNLTGPYIIVHVFVCNILANARYSVEGQITLRLLQGSQYVLLIKNYISHHS